MTQSMTTLSISPSTSEVVWLFGNKDTRQALALVNPSFSKIKQIKSQGFELLWDSAPSKKAAFEYAAEQGDGDMRFHEHSCAGCGNYYLPSSFFVGQRWRENHQKWIIFSGRLCEACAQETDDFHVQPVTGVKK